MSVEADRILKEAQKPGSEWRPLDMEREGRSFMRKTSWVFWLIYFVQKVANQSEGPTKMPFMRILKDPAAKGGFGLSPAEAGAFKTDVNVGWFIKALFGLITDNIPILGYRRKSWLIISSVLSGAAWIAVSIWGTATQSALFFSVMIANIMVAMSDVVCDGAMVQSAQYVESKYGFPEGRANRPLQASQWNAAFTAILLSTFAGGIIAQFFNLKVAAIISGIAPLILAVVVALLMKEERVAWDSKKAGKGFASIALIAAVAALILTLKKINVGPDAPATLWNSYKFYLHQYEWLLTPLVIIGAMLMMVKVPEKLLAPMAFMFLWFANPLNSDGQYFYQYFTQDNTSFVKHLNEGSGVMATIKDWCIALKLTDAKTVKEQGLQELFYGTVFQVVQFAAALAAVIFFKRALAGKPISTVFVWCIVGQVLLAAAYMVYPVLKVKAVFPLLLTGAFGGALSATVLLSNLSYAASNCPRDNQASIFAFFMGLANMGSMLGGEKFGSALYTAAAGPATAIPLLEDKTKEVAAFGHNGFLVVIMASLAFLVAVYAFLLWMCRKGYVGKEAMEE